MNLVLETPESPGSFCLSAEHAPARAYVAEIDSTGEGVERRQIRDDRAERRLRPMLLFSWMPGSTKDRRVASDVLTCNWLHQMWEVVRVNLNDYLRFFGSPSDRFDRARPGRGRIARSNQSTPVRQTLSLLLFSPGEGLLRTLDRIFPCHSSPELTTPTGMPQLAIS